MSGKPPQGWRALVRFQLVSPRGFLITAATLAVVFAVLHLVGAREHASVLCGQIPEAIALAVPLGVAYVFFYVAFALVVPVLVLAAGPFALLQRAFDRARSRAQNGTS